MTDSLLIERRRRWRQTTEDRIPDSDAAVELIDRVGIATLFPASPEIPNLYHAYVGDAERPTDSKWDSPSGHVYEWRWHLGRREAAFYGVVVRKRPTWVSWTMVPAVLRLRGELRTPDELFDLAVISPAAYRIAQALDESGGALSTGDLRQAAGFPTGKEQRAAYLKAVDELDSRLLLAKVFSPDELDMSHALVSARYPELVEKAEHMSRDAAYDCLLRVYLPHAMFAAPTVLARHLGVPEDELRASLDRLETEGAVRRQEINGYKGACYVCAGA
jgi:hypothetical protein